MKRITFVALALSIWVIPLSPNPRQPSAGVSKKEGRTDAQLAADAHDKQQAAETAALNSVLAAITKSEQERAAESHQGASDVKETIKAEWWLVYVGIAQAIALIFTLCVIWYQAKKTAEATQAMRDSLPLQKSAAEAALLNAQAVIYTERPWLILEQLKTKPGIGDLSFVFDDFPPTDRYKHTDCLFYIKNYGRTPAIVIAQKEELQMGNHGLRPPNPTFFDNPELVAPYVFPQAISRPKLATLALKISLNTKTLIDAGATFVWLCGYVRYRDSVPQDAVVEYETRFCYVYQSRGEVFWAVGPAEYNRTSQYQPQKTE